MASNDHARSQRLRIASVCAAVMLAACSMIAAPLDEYRSMQKWHFATTATDVPSGGITIQRDTASWRFDRGSIHLMQPLPDGAVTGLVFEGEGVFRMTIPDRVELAQLRRFTGREDLQLMEVRFRKAVVRTSDGALLKGFGIASGPFSSNQIATSRHDLWFEELRHDPDARVIAARLNPNDSFLRIDFDSETFGWLTYQYDGLQQEEITLQKFQNGYLEQWISLDRPEDRRPDGRPSRLRHEPLDLEHIAVKADLRKYGRGSTVGRLHMRSFNGSFEVEETLRTAAEGSVVASFNLHPQAKLESITEDGRTLEFIRDHVGKRSRWVANDVYDETVTVLLERPTRAGETRRISFRYTLELPHFAPGGYWYPTPTGTLLDPHTATLELTTRKRHSLYAMGTRKSFDATEEGETSVWVVERPAKMITFAIGERFDEKTLQEQDAPRVVVFGRETGMTSGDMMKNVGADVVNSLKFFQWLFDSRLPAEQIFVTAIASGHGQSFDGFIHLSEATFSSESRGASELFRAHEVAHQWWGHEVGWASYRDQWLSEAFAEYAAMMFIEYTMKDGAKIVDEIVETYADMINGSLLSAKSRFSRGGLIEMNSYHRGRIGPIDVGHRAGTRDFAGAYVLQSYHKGPLVLHMLRTMIRNREGNDDKFIAILRDFMRTHRGKAASTDDFQAVVETNLGGDWNWFFDAWIRRAEIPNLEWSYKAGTAPGSDGSYSISFHVKRSGTDETFILPVPATVELSDGRKMTVTMVVKTDDSTYSFKLPSAAKRVEFNPGRAVLSAVKKE